MRIFLLLGLLPLSGQKRGGIGSDETATITGGVETGRESD